VRPDDTNHAPESVLHRQGKALVTRWAATHPAVADVAEEVPLGGGERIADVLLTSHSGNRLGVPVVWLFGAIGALSPLTAALRQVHKRVLERQQPLLWINPVEEVIGWARDQRGRGLLGPSGGHAMRVEFATLDDLVLRATGLLPTGWVADRETERASWRDRGAAARTRQGARTMALRHGTDRPLSPGQVPCATCGLALDPILIKRGTHFGCEPH